MLDNLIHGYFILGHPERLDYDYEHIYALVAPPGRRRPRPRTQGKDAARTTAPLKTLFLGGGAYTFQRYMQHTYPGTEVDVAEIDPAVTNANYMATGPAPRHHRSRPPGATPASSSSGTRTASSTT